MNKFEKNVKNIDTFLHRVLVGVAFTLTSPGANEHQFPVEEVINQSVSNIQAMASIAGVSDYPLHVGKLKQLQKYINALVSVRRFHYMTAIPQTNSIAHKTIYTLRAMHRNVCF